jgi:hypothetical protein
LTTAHHDWLQAVGVSLLTALVIVSPFFWLGNASGHDFQFHAASWMDAAGQWKEGIVFPRWAEQANHGFGEPRFIFYPPLSWLLGAALSFVVPWKYVPAAFIVLVQSVSGVCAFRLTRNFFPVRAALLAAVCYVANPYALLIIYMRSDFAELLALAFFPLLALVAMRVGGVAGDGVQPPSRAMVFFAVVFAAVWLSNAPAGVLASYSMAAFFAWGAVTQRSWWPLVCGASALTLGFGFAAFYLVPAIYEQSWVNIAQALSEGLIPTQNFLYTAINDPEHNFFNWIASSAAIAMMLTAGVFALAARSRAGHDSTNKKAWNALLFLAVLASLMMFRFTLFLWNTLPELRFVQFPWRWMAVLAVPCAFFVGMVVSQRPFGWLWAVAVLMISAGTATWLVRHVWWDSQDIPVLQSAMASEEGFEGTDEYDPAGDDHYDLPAKAPRVSVLDATQEDDDTPEAQSPTTRDARVHILRWTAEEKRLAMTAQEPVRVALRLLNYRAWLAEVNGHRVVPQRPEKFNQMILPVPAGESQIRVHFQRTPDRTVGGAISLMSCVVGLLLWLRRLPVSQG